MDRSKAALARMLVALCLTPALVTAQRPQTVIARQAPSDTAAAARRFGRAQIMGGGAQLDVKAVNAAFAARGYPTLPRTVLTYGGGAHLTVGRVILGGSAQTILTQPQRNAAFTTKLSGGYGLFDLGLAVISSPHTSLFLVGGAGGGRITTKIQAPGGFSFDSALANSRRGVELRADSYLYHVGLGIDQFLILGGTTHLNVGLRAGYVGRATATKWRTNDAVVAGAPNAAFTGAYIRFTIGRGLKHRVEAILPAVVPVVPWLLR